jgi:hypothetical protein
MKVKTVSHYNCVIKVGFLNKLGENMKSNRGVLSVLCIGVAILFAGCQENSTQSIEDSLETVPMVSAIQGAQNTTATVNDGNKSYFEVDFSGIIPNEYLDNGTREAWCIAYDTPISSNGSIHEGLRISLAEGERWQPIRRLLGIKNQLLEDDPNLTFREIQVAIWALRDFPKFDLDNIPVDEIPQTMVRNGQFNFSKSKVKAIVERVTSPTVNREKSNTPLLSSNGDEETQLCVVETDSDTQTLITPCGDTFWAYGEISFREVYGDGQWGWAYIFRPDENNNFSDTTPLIAGAGQDDGTLSAEDLEDHWVGELETTLDKSSDPNILSITYNAAEGIPFGIAHLWAGCDYETELPVNNGGSIPPGTLPFQYDPDEFFSEYTFNLTIGEENDYQNLQIAECEDDVYHIAAHGVVGDD